MHRYHSPMTLIYIVKRERLVGLASRRKSYAYRQGGDGVDHVSLTREIVMPRSYER